MGDGGAMFLGFLMATLGLKLRLSNGTHASALLVPLLTLGVTIFDTTLVTVSRARRGLLPFAAPGKDHAAHRLANLGLGQRGAVLTLYSLGIVSGRPGSAGLLYFGDSSVFAGHFHYWRDASGDRDVGEGTFRTAGGEGRNPLICWHVRF